MSYDQAIRQYGIDKPDMRLPAMTDIRPAFSDEDLAELRIDGAMNMVGIRIPNVGKISDREKKELRALSEELAKRNKDFAGVLYDFAQLEKKRPQVAAKIRELCGAGAGRPGCSGGRHRQRRQDAQRRQSESAIHIRRRGAAGAGAQIRGQTQGLSSAPAM